MTWCSEIVSVTRSSAGSLNGSIPLKSMSGEAVDTSEHLDFGFYDKAWHVDDAGLGPEFLSRWLSVSHRAG